MVKEEKRYYCDLCKQEAKVEDYFEISYPVAFSKYSGEDRLSYLRQRDLGICRECLKDILKVVGVDTEDSEDYTIVNSASEEAYQRKIDLLEDKVKFLKLQLEQAEEIVNNPDTLISQQSELMESLCRQLEEKDKTIGWLEHLGKHKTAIELFYENIRLTREQRQFAIQELNKVLDKIETPHLNGNSQKTISLSKLKKQIQLQIEGLKSGGSDGEE